MDGWMDLGCVDVGDNDNFWTLIKSTFDWKSEIDFVDWQSIKDNLETIDRPIQVSNDDEDVRQSNGD